jgi:nitronate monooxygenase
VGVTATSLVEARTIQDAGANFIVAQGIEAGGHRGIFYPDTEDDQLSTLELTKLLKQHSPLPIVAAGGLMNGRDIWQIMQMGASAAQLGTAFLCCTEAGTTAAHQDYLQQHPERGTTLTKSFSGRVARGIKNQFIELMDGQTILPFPIQNTMTGPIRQFAATINNGEYQSLWAGAHYAQVRNMSATHLMKALEQEMTM